jgi:hypothetical protein
LVVGSVAVTQARGAPVVARKVSKRSDADGDVPEDRRRKPEAE